MYTITITTKAGTTCLAPGLPRSGITILTGMRAAGKTTAAIDLVAAITTGQDSALGPVDLQGPGTAILCIAGDSPAHVAAQLARQGADLDHVQLMDCTSARRHLDAVVASIQAITDRTHPDLIVVDDIDRLLMDAGNHTAQDRQALRQLDDIAHQAGCAIVIVRQGDMQQDDAAVVHPVGNAAMWDIGCSAITVLPAHRRVRRHNHCGA
jgi:RecA-family ATPase